MSVFVTHRILPSIPKKRQKINTSETWLHSTSVVLFSDQSDLLRTNVHKIEKIQLCFSVFGAQNYRSGTLPSFNIQLLRHYSGQIVCNFVHTVT